ncbi:MAG: hypothetical protein K2G29_04125, partial [Muribaculaceae bacterium]|nr:hypothetical protein [Muribaculaceae bacterium]
SADEPSDTNIGKVKPTEIVLSPSTRSIVKTLDSSYLKYTTDLIKFMTDTDPEISSLATSPLSTTMLISMIANGVNEESRKEITDYLGTDDIVSLNDYCKTILAELPGIHPHATANLANAAWVNKHFNISFNKDYLTILNNCFNGKSFSYDFTEDQGKIRKEVNNWSAKNTGGLIPNLDMNMYLQDSQTMLVLLSSIYFKAPWEHFPKKNTKKSIFHGSRHDMSVEMMTSRPLTGYPYYKDDDFDIFAIDLADGAYWLHIILPAEGLTLRKAVEIITPEFMSKVNNEIVTSTLTVSMPKFTIKSCINLNNLLKTNGVASFMYSDHLTMFETILDQVAYMRLGQNTVFSIDESGADVASSSFGEMIIGSPAIDPSKNYQITVDRPFIFYITESSTKTWITSGFFANPDLFYGI